MADPYGYENSETYGVYGSYGDPGGAGYVNPLNGNQMREQAFQTADNFVHANTGQHLGSGIMSQNGSGGTVDENGDPVDDYGYGYGAYGARASAHF